jgi:hypothetical protein
MRTHTSVHRALTTVFAPPPLQTPVELPDVLLAQASILFYANRHREAVLEEAGAEEPVAGDKEEQEQLQAALAASLQLQKGINAYMSTTGDDALQYEGAPAGDKLEEEQVQAAIKASMQTDDEQVQTRKRQEEQALHAAVAASPLVDSPPVELELELGDERAPCMMRENIEHAGSHRANGRKQPKPEERGQEGTGQKKTLQGGTRQKGTLQGRVEKAQKVCLRCTCMHACESSELLCCPLRVGLAFVCDGAAQVHDLSCACDTTLSRRAKARRRPQFSKARAASRLASMSSRVAFSCTSKSVAEKSPFLSAKCTCRMQCGR